MKRKLFLVLLFIFITSTLAMAKEITVKFEWQPNTEPDLAQYVVYHRVEGQGYDYSIPIKIIPAPTVTTDVKFDVPAGISVANHFVIRAEDTNQNQSGDSNEVHALIDLRTPSAPNNFTAVYDDATQTINFSWEQIDPNLVSKWRLYSSSVSGGSFVQIGEDIINDGSTYTSSWNVPTDGDYYFVIVAFRDGSDVITPDGQNLTSIESAFSSNSSEIYAQVKIHPSPVQTFKVKLRVY